MRRSVFVHVSVSLILCLLAAGGLVMSTTARVPPWSVRLMGGAGLHPRNGVSFSNRRSSS